jgi:hypothetical protein
VPRLIIEGYWSAPVQLPLVGLHVTKIKGSSTKGSNPSTSGRDDGNMTS